MAKLRDQVICRICLDPNQIGKSHINRSTKILLIDSFELIVPVTCACMVGKWHVHAKACPQMRNPSACMNNDGNNSSFLLEGRYMLPYGRC